MKLVRRACMQLLMALQRNEVSTIFVIIFLLFSFLSVPHTFLPEWVIIEFRNFELGLNSIKYDCGLKRNSGDPPCPLGLHSLV